MPRRRSTRLAAATAALLLLGASRPRQWVQARRRARPESTPRLPRALAAPRTVRAQLRLRRARPRRPPTTPPPALPLPHQTPRPRHVLLHRWRRARPCVRRATHAHVAHCAPRALV
jgi:hypothetical protein